MQFIWPWIFILLPLPLLVRLILPDSDKNQDAPLHIPFIEDFNSAPQNAGFINKSKLLTALAALAWILLIFAASRPQWLGERIDIPVSGRDLMMAVDLSGSMAAEDFDINGQTINRLQAVKIVAGEFIKHREGDRIGLILFGQQAYLQTPLTFDTQTINTMLQESLIGIAGKMTAIGDAIGLAIKRLNGKSADKQVLILLTDGTNTAGEVPPLKAAELAAKENLKIYTIGIGAASREVGSFMFKRTVKNNEIDEKTLNEIAEITGGKYFRAHNTKELNKIYSLIDELEPVEQETQSFRPVMSLFMWPLTVAFILSLLIAIAPFMSQLTHKVTGLFSKGAASNG
ncbi:MAG: BatB protein [endosymbiont of Galathealinum brachiosum]|uniref:BatB protein n=1 Tax=endosymbiont of Galathealinum brachiosum TaxID=2200906 RepID=A0A370DC21_9GAMM|nr:MAG: BatB protein [endosymbiont of Galathealinum brachiosum]